MLPATLAAELTVPCDDIDDGIRPHLVWIHRDGTVTTPTHHSSDAQQVATLLGDIDSTACTYWTTSAQRRHAAKNIPAGREQWRFTHIEMWTPPSMRTAITAITGHIPLESVDPVATLGYMQAFLNHHVEPHDIIDTITRLQHPDRSIVGWRRCAAATPEEVDALLDAGVHVDRLSSAIALDIQPRDAAVIRERLQHAGAPDDLLFVFANTLPASIVAEHLRTADADETRTAVRQLARLRDVFATGTDMYLEQVRRYLFESHSDVDT